MPEFVSFPKLHRLTGPCVVTEKIDGTNAQILIDENLNIFAGSRTRFITVKDDNFGFAKFVEDRKDLLIKTLGIGTHYGEFWGSGIQRNYGLKEKRFSLFNTYLYKDLIKEEQNNSGIYIVPILVESVEFDTDVFLTTLKVLKNVGSSASPGFMNPEGIVIFDSRSGESFKKTFDYDIDGKGKNRDKDGNLIK